MRQDPRLPDPPPTHSFPNDSVYSCEGLRELKLTNKVQVPLPAPALQRKLKDAPTGTWFKLFSSGSDCLVIGQDSEQVATDFITHAVNFLYKRKAEVEANDALSEPVKDQGLTSCRVLILVPRKAEAIRVIETLIRLHCKGKRKRINKKTKQKYTEEFLDADPVSDIVER